VNRNPWIGALDVGDRIEFGLTVEITDNQGRKWWPKCGVSVAKRPDEGEEQARDRATNTVFEFLDGEIKRILAR